MVLLNSGQTAESNSHQDTNFFSVTVGDLETGILESHFAARHGIMDKGIHFLDFLVIEIILRLESMHFTGDSNGEVIAHLKPGNRPDAGFAFTHRLPVGLHTNTQRRHHTQPCNNYTS